MSNSEKQVLSSEENSVHLARFYHHGAHAGNVRYEIEAWGMNSPARGVEIKRRLDEFISTLQVG
ncbi:hypothetical protein [Candidatus Erwinia dacicola]|uniref:Uncharacterized protein n=1 Tax=Candidatus Erwinia dacicola TaxID=252393 RepID=A0A328TPM8_9GAMM|nr:hypothetical protein [Candidatus Erwinia dacicola]NJC99690.1 hypothetical protein [Candidatus Erwinia dacicola]RAP71462.1 hypothetical protein ACZ87_01731 [Candidatus Erwinia dacicola]